MDAKNVSLSFVFFCFFFCRRMRLYWTFTKIVSQVVYSEDPLSFVWHSPPRPAEGALPLKPYTNFLCTSTPPAHKCFIHFCLTLTLFITSLMSNVRFLHIRYVTYCFLHTISFHCYSVLFWISLGVWAPLMTDLPDKTVYLLLCVCDNLLWTVFQKGERKKIKIA